MYKKIALFCIVILSLQGGIVPRAVLGNEVNTEPVVVDMPRDYSTAALTNAITNDLLSDTKGKIMPQGSLTQGEMLFSMIVALGLEGEAEESIAKGVQMGLSDLGGPKILLTAEVTREQVFVAMAHILALTPAADLDRPFADAQQVSPWARGYVYALVNGGYVQGWDQKLSPRATISRKDFAVVLDSMVKTYASVTQEGSVFLPGNVMINRPNVRLKNINVRGDLIIGDGVGQGGVALDGVTVSDRLLIRGGGIKGVKISGNSEVKEIIMAKTAGGGVGVVTLGSVKVAQVRILDGRDDVTLEGTFGLVNIATNMATVICQDGTIDQVILSRPEAKVIIESDCKITQLSVTEEAAIIENRGSISKMVVRANGVIIKGTVPDWVIVDPLVTKEPIYARGEDVAVAPAIPGSASGGYPQPDEDTTTADKQAILPETIRGLTQPRAGEAPVTIIMPQRGATGIVSWAPIPREGIFAPETSYRATITLTAEAGYEFKNLVENAYAACLVQATAVTSPGVEAGQNTLMVTAIFPKTDRLSIDVAKISGFVQPEIGNTPIPMSNLSTTDKSYRIDEMIWQDNPAVFAPSTAYQATVILTAEPGYTFTAFVPEVDGQALASMGVIDLAGQRLTFTTWYKPTLDPEGTLAGILQVKTGADATGKGFMVTLSEGGKFAAILNADQFTLSDLPIGMTITSVDRESDQRAMINLAGSAPTQAAAPVNMGLIISQEALAPESVLDIVIPARESASLEITQWLSQTLEFKGVINESLEKIWGEGLFQEAATLVVPDSDNGNATIYSSSAPSVATIEASTGQVTILKPGETLITAARAQGGDYGSAVTAYTLTVSAKEVTEDMVEITGEYTYTGQVQAPIVTLVDDHITLIRDVDYGISVAGKMAGDQAGEVTITGLGNYRGTVRKTFEIAQKRVNLTNLTVVTPRYYDGTTIIALRADLLEADIVPGDKVAVESLIGEVDDRNVGVKKEIVQITDYSFVGVDADNYEAILPTTNNIKVNINTAWLYVTGFEIVKVYDGTNACLDHFSTLTFTGLQNNETATVGVKTGDITATYKSIDVGDNIPIRFNKLFVMTSPKTAQSTNYTIMQPDAPPDNVNGTIIKATATVLGQAEIAKAVGGEIVSGEAIKGLTVHGVSGQPISGTWSYRVPDYTEDGTGTATATFAMTDTAMAQNYEVITVEVTFTEILEK